MTSRFFATGDTTSEPESEVSSSESEVEVKKKAPIRTLVDSSSDDDDGPREVKSKKDKVYDAIETTTKSIRVGLRKKEWQSVSTLFAALQKLLQAPSTLTVIKASGFPAAYIRCMIELEEHANDAHADKEYRDALPQLDGKALSTVRQNVQKLTKLLTKKIDEYQKNPLPNDEEELNNIINKGKKAAAPAPAAAAAAKPAPAKAAAAAAPRSSMFYSPGDTSSEEEEEEEEEAPKPAAKPAAAKPAPASRFMAGDSEDEEEEEDDDDDIGGGGDDDDSDSDVDVKVLDSGKITREFWLKKEKAAPAKPLESRRDRRLQQQQQREQRAAAEGPEDSEADEANVYTAAGAAAAAAAAAMGLAANDEVTPAAMNKRLREITALRGKRSMNYPATIAELRALEPKAQDTATVLKIQSLVPLLLFDLVATRDSLMSQRALGEAITCVYRLLATLKANPTVRLAEDDGFDTFVTPEADDSDLDVDDYVDDGEHDAAWARRRQRADEEAARRRARVEEELRREQASAETSGLTFVEGNLYAYVFKIGNEFYRALQLTEHTSPEYVNRLREQRSVTALFRAVRDYYRAIGKARLEARVVHLWIEYEYYFYHAELDVLSPGVAGTPAAAAPSATLVDELAETLYRSDDMRARVRALLFQTYSWLIHSRYDEARERLLSAHVQEVIGDLDLATRSLYNRVMVQLGLAAFRRGQYHAAVVALADFQSSKVKDKVKELLGQGVAAREAKEEELEEARRRVLPYHMHLSMTDLIEATLFVSAMLTEVPAIAEAGWHQPRRTVSRAFRREYQRWAASLTNAHGDTSRDLIMRAARSLFEADWAACVATLSQLRLWSQVHGAAGVKALLEARIKQEALKVFLLTYGAAYTTIGLSELVERFALPEAEVVRVASKLLHGGLLSAAWETTPAGAKCLRVTAPAVSRAQRLAVQFVDKVQQFSERVEKLQDQRPGFRNHW